MIASMIAAIIVYQNRDIKGGGGGGERGGGRGGGKGRGRGGGGGGYIRTELRTQSCLG